jgi:16S rRNA (guanine966-N2)-methyltransferase
MPFPNSARVLDLFSGSGILGFEALSRGAQEALFVDIHKKVAAQLQTVLKQWPHGRTKVFTADCNKWLNHHTHEAPFDLIFLDPPFHQPELLEKCLTTIQTLGYLAQNGAIYFERGQQATVNIPAGLQIHREKRFGSVVGTLLVTHTDANDQTAHVSSSNNTDSTTD